MQPNQTQFDPAPTSPPLPVGTRLVHIGPPKTGTTAIQAAFHGARTALASQGVRYAGRAEHSMQAVHAAIGRPYLGGAVPSEQLWHRLRDEILAAPEDRVLLSSEAFAYAEPGGIRRVVDDLDPLRVHVVVTLRPLARIVPSQWLQNLQSGTTAGYAAWLRVLFDEPSSILATTFWRMHRHDQLVARWAEVAGPERVTVVVADDRDPGSLFGAFEGLLGLRAGSLVPATEAGNRSLTLAEAEVLRGFNVALRARALQDELGAKEARTLGTQLTKLRAPDPAERRVTTPGWALERIAAVQDEVLAGLGASGVTIIGDPAELARAARPEGEEPPGDPMIAGDLAGSIALDLLTGTGAVPLGSFGGTGAATRALAERAARHGLDGYPTALIARTLARRVARGFARRLPFRG